MTVKPNKSAASAKPSFTSTFTTTVPPARFDTNPADANQPALLPSLLPNSTPSLYKERPGPTLMTSDPDHRQTQPYQGAAPSRQVQQPPSLSTGQAHQPSYAVQGVFSPPGGLQSPYLGHPQQQFQQHPQPNEGAYYASNPSPRSTTSAAYYSSDKPDSMAAATAPMQRPYPQIYNTPQSNSPASVTSPQSHDHGRPMYSHPPSQMAQPMYPYSYPHMGPVHQSPYSSNPPQSQMNQQPMLPYQQNPNSLPQGTMANHPSIISSSPRVKPEHVQQYSQPPQSQNHQIQSRPPPTTTTPSSASTQPGPPGGGSNAAPGPIPATTPLVVRQDQNGVQWIAFEYSRDRVKMEYTIRCDVESVDATQLSQEFKGENCVYPRACVPKEQYKGNRLAYETDCNQVGWALAELNTCLRGKRGLIQRAVDSWRNSNQDPRLRSRRVRRQAKMHNRAKVGSLTSQAPGSAGPVSGNPGPDSMGVPHTRAPGKISTSSQPSHHHAQHEIPPAGHNSVGVNTYSNNSGIHRPNSTSQQITSPSDLRHAHTYPGYQAYPSVPTTVGSSIAPSLPGVMHGYGRSGGHTTMGVKTDQDADLYGNVPEDKRRKFISVDDTQKNTRIRVKVTLDQIDTSEIPDSYRKQNSVFPRAYFPLQMQSATESSSADRFVGDDIEEMDDGPPIIGRTAVPCQLPDGEGMVEVSQLSKNKKDHERRLNELGYRMAWGQSRVFANRPIFLARALNVYRNKQCDLLSNGRQHNTIPSHLKTRPGRRRWQERSGHTSHELTPAVPNL